MQPGDTTPQPLRAVLFDFDGTLADSYPAITASVNHVRAAHGLPPLSEDEVRPHVGRGPAALLRSTVPEADPVSDVARYRAHHPSVMFTGTRLFPGVADAVASLDGAGYRLAVCSNKPRGFTDKLLEHFKIVTHFAAVLGPEDVARPKPAPDMLLTALPRLGVTAAEALYVGDMVVDIQTARAAGLHVWVVPTGSDKRDVLAAAAPDRVLHDLHELPGLLGAAAGDRGAFP
jgi:phosphoglycolate phosphatase